LNKHAGCSAEGWVDESADEIHGDEGIDFRKREERITNLRTDALQEVRESLVHFAPSLTKLSGNSSQGRY
jgi:hypothetical protein